MKSMMFLILSLFVVLPASASDILGPNFHEIDRGRFYRSAQLDSKEFSHYIQAYGIKTIISLREAEPKERWYQDELVVSRKYGVEHHDIPMLAEMIPHRENLIRLLDLYKSAPRPILIHCQGGADRSGEVSAIYQMLYQGKSREESLKMLTWKYHHVEMFKPAKRYFISQIWQGEDWAYNDYHPCEENYRYYDKTTAYCKH
ncbi:MAG: tyrosine-protein phosphatase [Bdellovibrio sp.]|nr:tyrosine-protein phosphatase [Bdellovibrio sp.]